MFLKKHIWLATLLLGLLPNTACNNDDEPEISAALLIGITAVLILTSKSTTNRS